MSNSSCHEVRRKPAGAATRGYRSDAIGRHPVAPDYHGRQGLICLTPRAGPIVQSPTLGLPVRSLAALEARPQIVALDGEEPDLLTVALVLSDVASDLAISPTAFRTPSYHTVVTTTMIRPCPAPSAGSLPRGSCREETSEGTGLPNTYAHASHASHARVCHARTRKQTAISQRYGFLHSWQDSPIPWGPTLNCPHDSTGAAESATRQPAQRPMILASRTATHALATRAYRYG